MSRKRWTSEAQILAEIERMFRLEQSAIAEAVTLETQVKEYRQSIARLEGSKKKAEQEYSALLVSELPGLRLRISKANKLATRYEKRRVGPLKEILAAFKTALLPGETDEAVVEK